MTASARLAILSLLALPLVASASSPAASPLLATRAEAGAQRENSPYDGRFTFVRLRFTPGRMDDMGGMPVWAHDYPRAETNLMKILDEMTLLAPRIDGNIIDIGDPELSKYPFAYICEPGYWSQTDEEAEALSDWLLKGGFLIVDDFRGGDIQNFQREMRRVVPGMELVPLDVSHPIFHSFFEIESLDFSAPTFRRFPPAFFGVFADNDRSGRLLAVVNYNNDIGDFWEFSDVGWLPVEATNDAYKLGVNYVVYSMMH